MQNSWSDEEIGSKRIATPWEKRAAKREQGCTIYLYGRLRKKKMYCAIEKVWDWKSILKVLIKFSLNLNSFSQISFNFEPNKLPNDWGNEFFIPPLKLLNKKNEWII